jgi:hypothetical protein
VTHLHSAILAFEGVNKLLASPRLPQPMATAILVQSLGSPEARKGPPPKPQLEVLRRQLFELYSGAQGDADARILRDAPWLLWDGTPRLAATLPRLLSAVQVRAAEHQRTFRNLIEAWIVGFDAKDATISETGNRIGAMLESATDRRLEFWRQVHRRLAFFDATKGPSSTARWLLSGPEEVPQVLATTGLNDPVRGGGGYSRAVQVEVVSAADEAMRGRWAEQALARASVFLAPDNRLRFPDQRGDLARGLTKPWWDRRAVPFEPAKAVICDFLVRHLKDPRTNPGNWQAAGEDATNLVRRWMASASLDMFFGLIAQHAKDQHWPWRAAFWKACMDRCNERGLPFDAWVALGSQVRNVARASSDLRDAYGTITGQGVQPSHAVLLMRVGPITLCDWSHDGTLRAWPNDWQSAPRLYRREYERSELTSKCLDFPPNRTYGSRGEAYGKGLRHDSSNRGYWQGSAAELLARRAGVHLTAADWQPR